MPCNSHDDVRGFNTFNSFNATIDKILSDNIKFEFIIVSGDISQTCTTKSYLLFQKVLKRLNKPAYCIPGNHDDPALLQHHFPHTPTNTISTVQHEKILLILINTQVKNQQYGVIKDNDLEEIISTIKASTKNIAIILHHPPIKIQSQWMDNIGLKNGNEFLDAIGNFENVKLILFGHVHQTIDTAFKNIKIMATPSTCYQFKPRENKMTYDDLPAGYRTIKINTDGTIESSVYRVTSL